MFRAFGPILLLLLLGSAAAAQTLERVETELLAHLVKLEESSNYGGSADYEVLAAENAALQNALIKYGAREDVLRYAFPKLTDRMFITTSGDGKLRAYSWDSNEGGTMHDFLTVYQYQDAGGKVRTWTQTHADDTEERGAGSFVHQIFQADATPSPVYLVVRTFIASTSLAGQGIHAFRITGDKLEPDVKVIRTASGLTGTIGFSYDFFSVADRPERPVKLFSYDEKRRAFSFPVVIEDARTPQGRVTNRSITYRFDGRHFVKVP